MWHFSEQEKLGRQVEKNIKKLRDVWHSPLTQNATTHIHANQNLQSSHNIQEKIANMYERLVVTKPLLPIQYMVDYLSFEDKEQALQDEYGLSEWRQGWLNRVFEKIDVDNSGQIDFKEIADFTSKYGSTAMNEEQLKEIFKVRRALHKDARMCVRIAGL